MKSGSKTALQRKLLDAENKALAGDWQAAHLIVQDHDDDEVASWIHAVAHRMEGDLGNARYWYGRCGRRLREEVPAEEELREIETVLTRARS
jgi:hypothetical protein